MRQNFDLFFVRFLIYFEFSSNLAQSQNSWSIRLEMEQEKVKTLLFKNNEKITFFSLPIYNILQAVKTTQRRHRYQTSQRVKWYPGNLPDLTPSENIKSQMMNLQQKDSATSITGLKKKLHGRFRDKSYKIILKKLYKLMPRRKGAVIQAQGGHKKYQFA